MCFESWATSSACSSVDPKGRDELDINVFCLRVDKNVWLCTLHALLWDVELTVVFCDFFTLGGQARSFSRIQYTIVVVQHFQASI